MHDIRFKLLGNDVGNALGRLIRGLPTDGDFTPVTQTWARILKTGTQLRFRTMRTPEGQPWEKSRRAKEEGGQTLSLTRRLRNSITSAHNKTQAAVGTNVLYAAIHQFGGVIRAKNGPFLAIPVTPVAKAAGSPRNMPGLRVWQTTSGQYVMGSDDGTVHYLLRPSVKLPARPYLGASKADAEAMTKALQDHLSGGWTKG